MNNTIPTPSMSKMPEQAPPQHMKPNIAAAYELNQMVMAGLSRVNEGVRHSIEESPAYSKQFSLAEKQALGIKVDIAVPNSAFQPGTNGSNVMYQAPLLRTEQLRQKLDDLYVQQDSQGHSFAERHPRQVDATDQAFQDLGYRQQPSQDNYGLTV